MRRSRQAQVNTELLRLPSDVTRAIRRRAAAFDVTLAEAARQLMQPREVRHHLGLLDHVAWLQDRLERSRGEVERCSSRKVVIPKRWRRRSRPLETSSHNGPTTPTMATTSLPSE